MFVTVWYGVIRGIGFCEGYIREESYAKYRRKLVKFFHGVSVL